MWAGRLVATVAVALGLASCGGPQGSARWEPKTAVLPAPSTERASLAYEGDLMTILVAGGESVGHVTVEGASSDEEADDIAARRAALSGATHVLVAGHGDDTGASRKGAYLAFAVPPGRWWALPEALRPRGNGPAVTPATLGERPPAERPPAGYLARRRGAPGSRASPLA